VTEGRVQPRQHVPGREVLIEGVLRVVDRDSPVWRNPGNFVSATRRLFTPTNASVTFFLWAASRHLFSCRCKAVTRRLAQEVHLLVVQMQRADVNAPGRQLEYSIEATRSTYKLAVILGGSHTFSIVAQQ
jgi:hypothetical protein